MLSSVVMVSLGNAKSKARDAKRITDADQITKAVELYFNQNGLYPSSLGATQPNGSWANSNDASWTALGVLLSPYLTTLPKDPQQNNDSANIWAANGYSYSYVNCGNSYMFVFHTENPIGPDQGAYCGGTLYVYGSSSANNTVKTIGGKTY